MQQDEQYPSRKHPVHFTPLERHNAPILLHVTVCTKPRRKILANESVHTILRNTWEEASAWRIGYYLIMPDHIHLFCAPGYSGRFRIKTWVTYWRRLCARRDSALKGIWQEDCWDTQIRNQQHYARKLDYVAHNPVRHGLVEYSQDWEYQGRLCQLDWI